MYVEFNLWKAQCDQCMRRSDIICEQGHPYDPPEGWGYIKQYRDHDDRYYPSNTKIMVCPQCLAEHNEKITQRKMRA